MSVMTHKPSSSSHNHAAGEVGCATVHFQSKLAIQAEVARRLPVAVLAVHVVVRPAVRRRVAVPAIVDQGPATVLVSVLGSDPAVVTVEGLAVMDVEVAGVGVEPDSWDVVAVVAAAVQFAASGGELDPVGSGSTANGELS